MKKLLKATMKIVISFILLIAISITGSYVVNTYAAERTVVDGHSWMIIFMMERMLLQTR